MAQTHRLVVPDLDEPKRQSGRIAEAVRLELESRRNMLDLDTDLRSVTISVKMIQGTGRVRAVVVSTESEKILSNS
jgi:hypothetical protein